MINPVMEWFEITQYKNKKAMNISNLIGTTQTSRYHWTVYIKYYQGGEFLGHQFKNSLIEEEYDIKTNPYYPGNPQSNATRERIHQVLGNLVHTYNLQYTVNICR